MLISNMSEFQKVIFVNGLDESKIFTGTQDQQSTSRSQKSIEELSREYPFVAFVTTNSAIESKLDNYYNISNLWIGGNRLTRFNGIDPDNCKININGQNFKLVFNYNTGLLGIVSDTLLSSLRIIKVSYADVSGNDYEWYPTNVDNSILYINSIDNKFKILFEYITNDTSQNVNIREINKSLIFDNSKFNQIKLEEFDTDDQYRQQCEFTFEVIDQQTQKNDETYLFTSYISSNAIDDSFNPLRINLNPTDVKFQINNDIINSSTIMLSRETSYTMYLNMIPTNVKSVEGHSIKCICNIGNYLTIEKDGHLYDANTPYEFNIGNGKPSFTLNVGNEVSQQSIQTQLSFTFKNETTVKENDVTKLNINEYYNIQKTIDIIFEGERSDRYFYFGYENPKDNPSLLSLIQDKVLGKDILYDSDNDQNDHNNEYFYIAIPSNYAYDAGVVKNIAIKPRMNIYEYQESEQYKLYYDCLDWFNRIYQNITLNGIDFYIYKRIMPGKFYGKIQ